MLAGSKWHEQTFKNGERHVLRYDDLEQMRELLAHLHLQHWRLGEPTDQKHVADIYQSMTSANTVQFH